MNYYEAQEFMKKMHPGKNIAFDFDSFCVKQIEIIHTNGLPNQMHHIEFQQVKVTVDGMDPIYMPIAPHRGTIPWKYTRDMINKYQDVHLHDSELDNRVTEELVSDTGLSVEAIEAKKVQRKAALQKDQS